MVFKCKKTASSISILYSNLRFKVCNPLGYGLSKFHIYFCWHASRSSQAVEPLAREPVFVQSLRWIYRLRMRSDAMAAVREPATEIPTNIVNTPT